MSEVRKFEGDWRAAKAEIERQVDRIWLDEPEEVQKIRWGVIDSAFRIERPWTRSCLSHERAANGMR